MAATACRARAQLFADRGQKKAWSVHPVPGGELVDELKGSVSPETRRVQFS